MPVSIGEWRVRIGTFMRRRRKQYDYHYYWRKLHNLIKNKKNAEPPKEINNPECNISYRTGSSLDANSSPGKSASRPASSYNANLNTTSCDVSLHVTSCDVRNVPLCDVTNVPAGDVSNSRGNANSQTRSQCDGLQFDTITERGFPCDVNKPGHNDVPHSESTCAENSGSSTVNETNLVSDTTRVHISVPRPYVEDDLDNRHITINLMTHEYTPNPTEMNKSNPPEFGTSESYSPVPADFPGETDRIHRDKEETSDSGPSGIEDEVTEKHGSPTYTVLRSGTTSGEADAIKGNDCPDMTNILLLRSGDVERNPGPNDNPGGLTELELYVLAERMNPSDFKKVGLALGFTEAELSRFEKDKLGNSMEATYQMLYEWRKRVHESEARNILVNKLESIKLVQLADSLRKGQAGDHIPSMTEEEIQRVAEEVKRYYAFHLCQIQADPLNSELLLKFERIFTNLTLMEEDKGTKHKTPLLYDDLLRTKVNGIYPKRLLVEGEGGVGKTTLCAKIAWDWIHGKRYQDFKLVLVVLYREAKDKTVGEVVKSYLPDDNPVTAEQLDNYILSYPNDIFLVLDGLDEFGVGLNSNQQIAQITLNRLFKSGTVLITSRQWRSDEIRRNAYLRKVFAFIAVEGFSTENLSSYITKFFHPDTASSRDLNRFISHNDVIKENMAPYPIYTAMLCIMWKDYDGERREAMSKLQTFSQLFDEMLQFLIDHYLSKLVVPSADAGEELDENRSNILHHVLHIGCAAFHGLLGRRLVFREEEFQSCPGSVDTGCKVGVLTKEKQIPSRRDGKHHSHSAVLTVQFPHKLFQEYLSGKYLASLYNSNRNEYDRFIANIIRKAREYRYLIYFTSAQEKEVGLDIVSRLIAQTRELTYRLIDDDFIVDVAYESQDQAVAKSVAEHLSFKSSKASRTLRITEEMQAHTVSGHIFIINYREVVYLNIENSCGRTASEDLAEFMCSSRSLKYMQINSTMHDVFYSVIANKAVDSKIGILNIWSLDLSQRPSSSRDLAKFICKIPRWESLTLGEGDEVFLHDNFYSSSSSMASSANIEALYIPGWDLSKRPSASRDLAQFICKVTHLKDLTLRGHYHDDFYSTSSSMASSSMIETLNTWTLNLSERPSASRGLAQFICKMPHLKNLTLRVGVLLHDDFYSSSSSMASSAKIETLCIHSWVLSERPSASCDLAHFICKLPHLKNLTLDGQFHDVFYSTSSSTASSAMIETLNMWSLNLRERPSASRDLAQFICKMPRLKTLTLDRGDKVFLHDDFYSSSSSMTSSATIETLDIPAWDLSERPSASRDLALFICKMTYLKDLTLRGHYHDDFYSTSSSMASSAMIKTLCVHSLDLTERPSASRDLAQFICKMTHVKDQTLDGQHHDDFYSTSSSMASSAKIETLDINFLGLSERPSASRDLAQFICKMPCLKSLTLGQRAKVSLHDDFYLSSSSMASSATIETLTIWDVDLSERPSASRGLAQFICKMHHLKNLSLNGQYHDDFYSTSSSMASSTKIETLKSFLRDLSERPAASRDLAQFICKIPQLKNLTVGGLSHDSFYSTSSSIALSAKSGNTSPTLTDLTVYDDTLRGWQNCGSMFENVKRVTIQVWDTINYDVIQRIHLPGATELTIQTDDHGDRSASFHERPTSLPNTLLNISPQLVKVTFSDLVIGNRKVGRILQAFRSPHKLKHLKTIRFIRCGTDLSMDDVTAACVMEVEVEHGKPRGKYFK